MPKKPFERKPEQPFPYGEQRRSVEVARLRPGDIIHLQMEDKEDGDMAFIVRSVPSNPGERITVQLRGTGTYERLDGFICEIGPAALDISGFHVYNIRDILGNPIEIGDDSLPDRPYSFWHSLVKSFVVFENKDHEYAQ